VEPPLSEKEVVTMFIDTLQSPFYDKMIRSISSNFSDIVVIGERVESGMRSGKITHNSNAAINIKKPLTMIGKKKEGETHAVTLDQGSFAKEAGSQSPVNFQSPYVPYPYIATTSQALHASPSPPMMPYRPLVSIPPQTHPNVPLITQPQIPF